MTRRAVPVRSVHPYGAAGSPGSVHLAADGEITVPPAHPGGVPYFRPAGHVLRQPQMAHRRADILFPRTMPALPRKRRDRMAPACIARKR